MSFDMRVVGINYTAEGTANFVVFRVECSGAFRAANPSFQR